jgi:hypothetical protein
VETMRTISLYASQTENFCITWTTNEIIFFLGSSGLYLEILGSCHNVGKVKAVPSSCYKLHFLSSV